MNQRIRLIAAAAVMLVGLGVPVLPACPRRNDIDDSIAKRWESRRKSDCFAGSRRRSSIRNGVPRACLLPVVANQPRHRADGRCPQLAAGPAARISQELSGPQPGGNGGWGASIDQTQPESASPHLTHKIVNGDTLPLLAERYLGSASRANEIYEANRGVLAEGPGLLPVTKILKIPIGDKAGSIEWGAGSTEQ